MDSDPFRGRLPPGDEGEPWVWDAEVPPAHPPATNASASQGKATYSLSSDCAVGVESAAFVPLLDPVAGIEWTMPAGEHAAGEAMPYIAHEASAAQRSGGWVAGEAQHHDAGAWQAFETSEADDDIGFSLDALAPLQGAESAPLSGGSALGGTLGYESDGSTHSEASEVWSAGSEEDTSEPPSPATTHPSEPPNKPIEPSEPPPARAKPAARKAPSEPLEPLEPCPFCPVECCADGRKTRKRRRKAVSRTKHRHGRWWQTLGYTGPVSASSLSVPRLSVRLLKQLFAQSYCQRCSEVFRDHIIREKPNSAGCSRARACDECAKVLTHFTGDLPDHKGLWDRIDAKGYAKVRRSKPKSKPTRGFV